MLRISSETLDKVLLVFCQMDPSEASLDTTYVRTIQESGNECYASNRPRLHGEITPSKDNLLVTGRVRLPAGQGDGPIRVGK